VITTEHSCDTDMIVLWASPMQPTPRPVRPMFSTPWSAKAAKDAKDATKQDTEN
jgi:hypothetical protein